MENASKALIIAGAILLSILIIGLGMTVYNNASSAGGQANLDAQEIQAHNSQFLAYEGKQKGANIKTLANSIKINNQNNEDRIVRITFSDSIKNSPVTADSVLLWTPGSGCAGQDINTTQGNVYKTINDSVKSTTTYFVTFGYGNNGCIAGVDIHVYSDTDL